MPTNPNMVAIQTVTVGAGGAAQIEFTSIPQTYTDLLIVLSGRTSNAAAADDFYVSFNSTTTNYSNRTLSGNGSTASSGNSTAWAGIYGVTNGANATTSTFSNAQIYVPNYTSSNNKSVSIESVSENNATTAFAYMTAGLWSNSAAVTSVKIKPDNNFVQHSTATLYGVTSAGYGAKATGGIITSDANYYYHTFLASGTFTPTQNLTASIFSVGGGGGGGRQNGGGGGGGEVDTYSSHSLTSSTNYTVTVGAGGAGSTSSGAQGASGNTTSFSSLVTSLGGGGGGSAGSTNQTGVTGGSGGGGASNNGSPAGGSASGSNTNAGGSGIDSYPNGAAGGGGGGATAAGGNASTSSSAGVGGAGGQGYTLTNVDSNFTTSFFPFTGMTVVSSGGGGGSVRQTSGAESTGGAGGTGGGNGGRGSSDTQTTSPTNASSFGSGGGGGGGVGAAGANGYAGLVIVRYAK